jgi:hypothetical protein
MYLDYSIQEYLLRMVPIEKLKTLVAVGRKNPPVNHLGSK